MCVSVCVCVCVSEHACSMLHLCSITSPSFMSGDFQISASFVDFYMPISIKMHSVAVTHVCVRA